LQTGAGRFWAISIGVFGASLSHTSDAGACLCGPHEISQRVEKKKEVGKFMSKRCQKWKKKILIPHKDRVLNFEHRFLLVLLFVAAIMSYCRNSPFPW